jgi:hypothetical protein
LLGAIWETFWIHFGRALKITGDLRVIVLHAAELRQIETIRHSGVSGEARRA